MLKYRNGFFVPTPNVVASTKPVTVTVYPAKLAQGARKPKSSGTAGAQTSGAMRARADRRAIQAYASKGIQPK